MSKGVFMKVRFEGRWWKVSFLMNMAKLMGLRTVFYSAGSLERFE